jgi:hypothetical protein
MPIAVNSSMSSTAMPALSGSVSTHAVTTLPATPQRLYDEPRVWAIVARTRDEGGTVD